MNDCEALFSAAGKVTCRNLQHAVCINEKSYSDAGDAGAGRLYIGQGEFPQTSVFGSIFALALQDVDIDEGLIVLRGGKCLGCLNGNGAVFLYNSGYLASLYLNPQGMWRDI